MAMTAQPVRPDLETLLQTHGAALHRLARAYAGRTGEQEDLYQEMLLQLWRSLPGFKGTAAPGTWLYRVALNTALTWRRRTSRALATAPVDPEPHAPQASGGRSQSVILDEFLESLAPADRSVLLLYMEGLPNGEIADVTGFTPGAVGVRLHRIKQAFTARYVERG
jgi:RNA polymerase sigma-70 factor, ECF subfamily